MSEPVLCAISRKYSPCEITYRTHRYVYDAVLYHPLVSNILCTRTGCWTPEPDGYDLHVNLHGVIEAAPFGMHGVDAFAQKAGVQIKRRTPRMYLCGQEAKVKTEDDRYPKVIPPVSYPGVEADIAFHIPAEPRNKLWENGYALVTEFCSFLEEQNIQASVRIVGQDPVVAGKSHILKMANEIASSKLFIGPDSGGFHMAAALGVPTVVSLTEQFPASMRAYPKVTVVGDCDKYELFYTAVALFKSII